MKQTKRLIALLLSFALLFSFALPAMAITPRQHIRNIIGLFTLPLVVDNCFYVVSGQRCIEIPWPQSIFVVSSVLLLGIVRGIFSW